MQYAVSGAVLYSKKGPRCHVLALSMPRLNMNTELNVSQIISGPQGVRVAQLVGDTEDAEVSVWC